MPYIGTSPSNGVRRVHTYTATASQTTFSGASSEGVTLSYADTNYLDVYQNGILLGSADYTATSGTSVVLAQGASADDLIVIVVYDVFSVADTVSKTNGGTFDNGITIDEDGATVLTVDRATSDGTIVDLQKDGTSVGSIDSRSGIALTINSQSGNGNLAYGGTNYVEWNNTRLGVATDNTIDLGRSSGRWKDLYLSGGVYLGGTGSANLLDDYEEGTFTPAYELSTTNFDSITHDIQNGKYTKIGNVVYCYLSLRTDSITVGSGAGNVIITGLPFLPSVNVASPQIGRYHNWNTVPNAIRTQTSSATLLLVEENGTGSLGSGVMQTGTNDNLIDITFFYYTNA